MRGRFAVISPGSSDYALVGCKQDGSDLGGRASRVSQVEPEPESRHWGVDEDANAHGRT